MADMKMFRFEGDLYRMPVDRGVIVGKAEIQDGDQWKPISIEYAVEAMHYGMPVREDKGEWW